MVPPITFVLILTTFIAVAVRADAAPNEPGPGAVFKQGDNCRTAWTGDKDGKWSNMAIELMTGSDLQMVHLTTLVTGLDGNKDGNFEFICPEVDPYSAIYFYQYSAPNRNLTWTTRFTITDKDGKSVPPPEATQPDGRAVPWGNGKLVNPANAKPPPDGSSSNSTSSSSILSSPSKSVHSINGGRATGSPSNMNKNGTAGNNNNNGVLSVEYGSTWKALFMLAVTASTFALYL